MPQSNDRTVVSAAGDCQVRIFDLEYTGQSTGTSSLSSLASASNHGGIGTIHNGVRYLSEGDTGVKVFRSHSDRVKRIVTESSPYFFLTCSEDGEVRQWDLRQPDSKYPSYRSGRYGNITNDDVPPPLISYKRYHLDLNTISCSPSQPHYIALGGAHLHCFLHDRRMLGRDRLAERGSLLSSPGDTWHEEELMSQATQCVRKFAPDGQQRMGRRDNGHITACKISDANPNEIVVSWSGDWIYSFDLIRSPDASEAQKPTSTLAQTTTKGTVKENKDRKRKRTAIAGSTTSLEAANRAGSRQRTESEPSPQGDALLVQYENGQSEEIPLEPERQEDPIVASRATDVEIEEQRQASMFGNCTIEIKKNIYILGIQKSTSDIDPTGHSASFTRAIGLASNILPEMDARMRRWRYPIDPESVDILYQKTTRARRCSSRRFVQAAGTLARVLGGNLTTESGDLFTMITPAPGEDAPLIGPIPKHEHFSYDFLKAILLWLDSGVGAIVDAFTGFSGRRNSRHPIPRDQGVDAIDEFLIPYLLNLADENRPVPDVDVSPFEVDENQAIFPSEQMAVLAFARAIKIPFEDLSGAIIPSSSSQGSSREQQYAVQDRRTALMYWAFRVGRGLLLNASKEVNFAFVDTAFGGLGRADEFTRANENALRARLDAIDPNDEDVVRRVGLVRRADHSAHASSNELETSTEQPQAASEPSASVNVVDEGEDIITMSDVRAAVRETVPPRTGAQEAEDDDAASLPDYVDDVPEEDEGDADGGEEDDDDQQDESDSDDSDVGQGGYLFGHSAFDRRRLRERAEVDTPCNPHTRRYTGHCNVKTVKDVNFFGLQDEYVVSGSDSGHLFIWDRKTTQRLNILEGDGEVVNVVQGIYENLLSQHIRLTLNHRSSVRTHARCIRHRSYSQDIQRRPSCPVESS